MDKANLTLEIAAGCNIDTDSAGDISFSKTGVTQNNKMDLEVFDDNKAFVPEDWVDYDYSDDYLTTESITSELQSKAGKEQNAPKFHIPHSETQTSESPKSKKRKLPTFDELLENLDYNILYLNLTKLLQFLESNHKDMCFPFVLNEYTELFKFIVRNINILRSKSLDAYYRDVSDKILEAAKFEKTGFMLTYVYECRKGYQNTVLVIKKVYVNQKSEEEKSSSPGSTDTTDSIMQSSQSSSIVDTNKTPSRSPSPPTISRGFKLHCLRTALAFIKNDVSNTKEFPELSSEQAHFMQLLLDSVTAFTEFDKSSETKELYRALWEAVRIHSLKFEFRTKCVDTLGGKKSLVFEKIPKNKKKIVQMAANVNQPANNSHQITNPEPGSPKPEAPNLEPPAPEPPKLETPQPPKPETPPKTVPKPDIPEFLMPQAPKISKATKRLRKQQLKLENEILFIRQMPHKFINDTLTSIKTFLSDPEREQLTLVPHSPGEQEFYRKCLGWCRGYTIARVSPEFNGLQSQILMLLKYQKCKVLKKRGCKINEVTGLREVNYIKPDFSSVLNPNHAQSTPKMKKVNIQNVLKMAATTDNINLSSVVNLNQSLRNKKKNKKAKKEKLRAQNKAGGASNSQGWTDDSSSETSSDRSSSLDRSKVPAIAKYLPKSSSDEVIDRAKSACAERLRLRRDAANHISQVIRKEQLIEALSVPVQSDKAMRMMRGMGWSGGALGARGNGITEPLMPTLDIARGAGLGHNRKIPSLTLPKKSEEPKSVLSWVSETSNTPTESENDIIVQKTKQLLLDNPTFDSITKLTELPKPLNPNDNLPNSSKSSTELPKPLTSNVKLPNSSESSIELPKPLTSNVKLPDSIKLPTHTRFSDAEQKLEIPFSSLFRKEILYSVLKLLHTNEMCKTLTYAQAVPKTCQKFVQYAMDALKSSHGNRGLFLPDEQDVYKQIQNKYKEVPQYIIKGFFSDDFMQIELKKLPSKTATPVEREISIPSPKPGIKMVPAESSIATINKETSVPTPKPETIAENAVEEYIKRFDRSSMSMSKNAYEGVKFRVLFLLNILDFIKSFSEEIEIHFNKYVTTKQRGFIEKIVDGINSRIKFGSSPVEINLSLDIKENVRDAFLVAMFDHQYTSVTINKYFRFKRLNRPDNAVRRKSEISLNIDLYSSDATSQPKLNVVGNMIETKANIVEKIKETQAYTVETRGDTVETKANIIETKASNVETEASKAETQANTVETKEITVEITKTENNVSEDGYMSDTSNAETKSSKAETKEITVEIIKTENTVSEDGSMSDTESFGPYDSDDSSVEEYTNSNATNKVPKLPPGEEGVNLSNFLHLYKKKNLPGVNSNNSNDSASNNDSKKTENRNNKNDIGNGNIFIDNNDNQVIDMKREGNSTNSDITEKENIGDSDLAEYVLCGEEVFEMAEESNEVNTAEEASNMAENGKETVCVVENVTGNENNGTNTTDIAKKEDFEIVNLLDKDNKTKSGDGIIEEVFFQIEDSESNTIKNKTRHETISDPFVTDNDIKGEVEHVVIKDINISEPQNEELMEVNSVNEETMEKNQEGHKVEPLNILNRGKILEVTNKDESIEATNSVKSSEDIIVVQAEDENSITLSDNQIMKESHSEVKTDCDISKENVDLSENCDTQPVVLETDGPSKQIYTEIHNVAIVHIRHPIRKLTHGKVTEIQLQISKIISQTTKLPLLMCHGFENGRLIYSCHNKNTYDWLQETLSVVSNIKVYNAEVNKMAVTFYCFYNVVVNNLFRMIELYNRELSTKDWVVEKKEKHGGYNTFVVKMDKFSINFIQASGLALFAGVDKVEFSPIWE